MELDQSPISSPSGNNPRNVLQASWNAATRECGAARVTIVNDIDDEPIPSSIDASRFQYCESDYLGYVHGPCSRVCLLTLRLNSAESHIDALVGCECQGTCTNPLDCHCQGAADTAYIGREGGAAKFAYENVSPPEPNQREECADIS